MTVTFAPAPEHEQPQRQKREGIAGPPAPMPSPAPGTNAGEWRATIAAAVAVALAMSGLASIFSGTTWVWWPLLEIAVIAATGGVLSALRTPIFLVPVGQAVVGLCVLVAGFSHDAPLGFVPTPDDLAALRATLQEGVAAVSSSAVPVTVTPGLIALTTLGIGTMALLVHVFLVCLRVPVLAGVPLAAIYFVPAFTVPTGAPWWGFGLAAAGWLIVLVTDQRLALASWGRVLLDRKRSRPSIPRLGGAATRLGVIAIALALVVPLLLPGIAGKVLSGHGGDGDSGGDQPIGLSPLVSLRRELTLQAPQELFSYQTNADKPSYLRTVVLEDFDGESWLQRSDDSDFTLPLNGSTPGSSRFGGGTDTTYEVTSPRLDTRYLPLPYHTSRAQTDGEWRWNATTEVASSATSSTLDHRWTATASSGEPTPAQLRSEFGVPLPTRVRDRTTFARGVPASVIKTAQDITAGSTGDYARALALQNWFLNNFQYSTDVAINSTISDLEQFLRDRKGYCQQFAATMALMARTLGIPSRVVVGFTPGTLGPDGQWHVTTLDAHAWPELYLGSAGWVRFEPTPRSASDGGEVATPPYAINPTKPASPSPSPSASATSDPSASASRNKALREQQDFADGGGAASAPTTFVDVAKWVVVSLLLVALVAAALTPYVIRVRRRRRRLGAGGTAEDAWAELRDDVRDLSGAWSDADTPRQLVARLTAREHLSERAQGAMERVSRALEQSRYGRTAAAGASWANDVSVVRRHLQQRRDRRMVWRARMMPASVVRKDQRPQAR